jgi:hypothetical protein
MIEICSDSKDFRQKCSESTPILKISAGNVRDSFRLERFPSEKFGIHSGCNDFRRKCPKSTRCPLPGAGATCFGLKARLQPY